MRIFWRIIISVLLSTIFVGVTQAQNTASLSTTVEAINLVTQINSIGFALILLGIAFMIAEAFIASFGVLAVGGVIALIAGSILLLEKETIGFQVTWPLIIGIGAVTAAFLFLVINITLKAHYRPVVSGREELVNQVTTIQIDEKGVVCARVLGELWQVQSDETLKAGQQVKVVAVSGLKLIVKLL